MSHTSYSDEEVAEGGKTLYEKVLRTQVETSENIGKIITMDIVTGDYEIGDDLIATVRRLQAKRPDAITWTQRIGFNAVYSIGGTLTRTAS
jgi:hypothetical protein